MGKRCNNCRNFACTCGLGQAVRQATPVLVIEDFYNWAVENDQFEGTMQEFILFMQGPQGDSLYEWAVKNGFTTLSKEEWYNQYIGTMAYSVDEWSGNPGNFTVQRNLTKPSTPIDGNLHFLKKSATGVKVYVVDDEGKLRTEIPDYPDAGSYTLKSVEGVLEWVLDS